MKVRRIVSAILIPSVLVAGGTAGYQYYQKERFENIVIDVTPVEMLSVQDWGSTTTVDGMVSNQMRQEVYLSTTQKVSEILVKAGDEVKIGTPILMLDTTELDLDLEDMRLQIEQKRLDISNGLKRLNRLQNTAPYNPNGGSGWYDPGWWWWPEDPWEWGDGGEEESSSEEESWSEEESTSEDHTGEEYSSEEESSPEEPSENDLTEEETSEEESTNQEESSEESTTEDEKPTTADGKELIADVIFEIDQAQRGIGKEEDPYIFMCTADAELDLSLINELMKEDVYAQIWLYNDRGIRSYILDLSLVLVMDENGEIPTEPESSEAPSSSETPSEPTQPSSQTPSEPTQPSSQTPSEPTQPSSQTPSEPTQPSSQVPSDPTQPSSSPEESSEQPGTQPSSDVPAPSETPAPEPTPESTPEPTPAPTPAPEPAPEPPTESGEPSVPSDEEASAVRENLWNDGLMWLYANEAVLTDMIPEDEHTIDIVSVLVNLRTAAGISSNAIIFPQPEEESFEYYTAEDLKREIHRQEISLRDMDLQRRKLELQYIIKQNELANMTITSTVAGVVGDFQDIENMDYSQPLTVIDGGGGFYLTGVVGELYLDQFQVGDILTCEGWTMNGMISCEAVVTEISEYPSEGGSYWGEGNPNVSYYPFTAYIESEEGLSNGMYLSINVNISGDPDAFFLDKMYIRSEDNRDYVWAANRETGLLEKRYVRLGKVLYDSYYEIKGGLSRDDLIAVPFGTNLREGVKTHNGMADDGEQRPGGGLIVDEWDFNDEDIFIPEDGSYQYWDPSEFDDGFMLPEADGFMLPDNDGYAMPEEGGFILPADDVSAGNETE